MGKGGSSEIKETSYQKAQADIAQQQWDLYQNDLKQYENLFMDKVDNLNDESNYTGVAGDAAVQTTSAFGDTRNQLSSNLLSSGVDPTSGKYQAAMDDVTGAQVSSQVDTTSRAQNDQASKYTAGLSDVVALGAGQKADALEGYSSLANSSGQKAISDAESAYNSKASMLNTIGTAAGAYAGYKTGNTTTTTNGSALNNPYLTSGNRH